jgi:hypothetical protein
MKHFTQKRDNLGYANAYGGVQNDQEWPCCLNNKLEFSQSLPAIAVLEQRDTVEAHAVINEEELQTDPPPSGKIKLVERNNEVNKLTKKEIISLVLTCFAVKGGAHKRRKGDIFDLLSREIETDPDRML